RAEEPRWRATPPRALHGIEHTAALEPPIEPHAREQAVRTPLDELCQQVPREQNDQRAYERRHIVRDLQEAVLKPCPEIHGGKATRFRIAKQGQGRPTTSRTTAKSWSP